MCMRDISSVLRGGGRSEGVRAPARFLQSVWRSVLHAALANEDVVAWKMRHPRTARFLRNRMGVASFWGLPFTLLTIAFAYALLEFFGVVQNVATTGVVLGADIRMENLLYAFRSGPTTSFFLWVTMLGNWTIALGAMICASIILFVWQKDRFIVPLWVTVGGSQIAGLIGKYELHRPRPSGTAVFTEQSVSAWRNGFLTQSAITRLQCACNRTHLLWRAQACALQALSAILS